MPRPVNPKPTMPTRARSGLDWFMLATRFLECSIAIFFISSPRNTPQSIPYQGWRRFAMLSNKSCYRCASAGLKMPTTSVRMTPPYDSDFFAFVESELYTAVLADSLDELGYRNQAMKESLRPVTSRHTFAGLARTIACMDQAYIPDR